MPPPPVVDTTSTIGWPEATVWLAGWLVMLRAAVGADWKGKLSPFMYVLGIASTFIWSPLAQVFYISVALIWLVPDKRIERTLHSH